MNKHLLIVEFISVLVILSSGESNDDLIRKILFYTKLGYYCGNAVKDDQNFIKCKDEVIKKWSDGQNETSTENNSKKRECCKTVDFFKCALTTAKVKCVESQYHFFEKSEWHIIYYNFPGCLQYYDNPSVCVTGGLIPDLVSLGQCGIEVKSSKILIKCKDQVIEKWSEEQNSGKKECCKTMGFLKCTLVKVKELCSEAKITEFENKQWSLIEIYDPVCINYTKNPSICGTDEPLPFLSMIFIAILVVLRIS